MYVFPLILGFAMLLGVTTAILRSLTKKQKPKWTLGATVLGAIILGVVMYNGIYRPYALYENHYKQATGMDFPTQGDYVFADIWTDAAESKSYSSVSLIHLEDKERSALIDKLKALNYGPISNKMMIAEGLDDRIDYVLALSAAKNITQEFGLVEKRTEKRNGTMFKIDRIRYYFGFLDDDHTVVVYVISE